MTDVVLPYGDYLHEKCDIGFLLKYFIANPSVYAALERNYSVYDE